MVGAHLDSWHTSSTTIRNCDRSQNGASFSVAPDPPSSPSVPRNLARGRVLYPLGRSSSLNGG